MRTVSPRVKLANKPGSPFNILIGMRVKIDSRTSNSAGSFTTGSSRGKNPRVVETMKAGSEVSSGLVSLRTLNERVGATEPMMSISRAQR